MTTTVRCPVHDITFEAEKVDKRDPHAENYVGVKGHPECPDCAAGYEPGTGKLDKAADDAEKAKAAAATPAKK
jgi:hypothetical protein